MLFSNIAALVAKGVVLSIQVAGADNGKLEVSVTPTSTTGKSGMSLIAKSFIATPQELDADFADVIGAYAATNGSLKDQLDAMTAQADAALKDAQEAQKTAKAAAPKAVSKTVPGAKKPVSPTLMSGDDNSDDGDDGDGNTEGEVAVGGEDATSSVDDPMPFTL